MLTAFYSARFFAYFRPRAGDPEDQISSREISFRPLQSLAGALFDRNRNLHTSAGRILDLPFCGPVGRICIILAIEDRLMEAYGLLSVQF